MNQSGAGQAAHGCRVALGREGAELLPIAGRASTHTDSNSCLIHAEGAENSLANLCLILAEVDRNVRT